MYRKSLVEITAELMAAIVAAQRAPEEDVVTLYKRLYQAVRESSEDEAKLREELAGSGAAIPAQAGFSAIPGFPSFPFPFPGFPGMPGMGAAGRPLGP